MSLRRTIQRDRRSRSRSPIQRNMWSDDHWSHPTWTASTSWSSWSSWSTDEDKIFQTRHRRRRSMQNARLSQTKIFPLPARHPTHPLGNQMINVGIAQWYTASHYPKSSLQTTSLDNQASQASPLWISSFINAYRLDKTHGS